MIAKLLESDPGRAARLYETFLAGCYEKAEELDGSSGNFGMFVHDLYAGWIEARQAAGADPDETAKWLLARMDDGQGPSDEPSFLERAKSRWSSRGT
jgi:hypothetical protein